RAEALRLRAEELIELDSLAFLAFVEAVRSGVDVESARRKTIDVPREIAARAVEVVGLARELEIDGNPNLKPDAAAAAILAQAAAKTAEMLVRVNESAGPRAARGRGASARSNRVPTLRGGPQCRADPTRRCGLTDLRSRPAASR